MSDSVRLEAAAIEAQAARARLMETMHELQARLDPPRLIDEAVTTAKSGALGLVEQARDAAFRRPGVAFAIGAGAALLVLRRPLRRLFRRKRAKPVETEREWYR